MFQHPSCPWDESVPPIYKFSQGKKVWLYANKAVNYTRYWNNGNLLDYQHFIDKNITAHLFQSSVNLLWCHPLVWSLKLGIIVIAILVVVVFFLELEWTIFGLESDWICLRTQGRQFGDQALKHALYLHLIYSKWEYGNGIYFVLYWRIETVLRLGP